MKVRWESDLLYPSRAGKIHHLDLVGGRHMAISYDADIPKDGEEYGLLRRASRELEQILEEENLRAEGHWELGSGGNGHPTFLITLREGADESRAEFSRSDLCSLHATRSELYLLLWALLHSENRRRIDRMMATEV